VTSGARKYRIIVCRGPECGDNRGSAAIHAAFAAALAVRGLRDRVELGWQSCFGRCRQGPNVMVHPVDAAPKSSFLLAVAPVASSPGGALYNGITPADVARILDEHVVAGRVVRELVKRPDYGTTAGETLRSQAPVGEGGVPPGTTPQGGKGGGGR
jgi:(2Fe-2S) ferredoxin